MERKAIQPKTLQEAIQYFSDEQTCIDTVAALRWPNGPVCVACEGMEHYYLATQKRWKCKECYKQFSVKLGTIFEESAVPLNKWLVALWMLVNCKNGVSSYELSRTIGVTQKTAWFILQRLRLALAEGSIEKLGGTGGPVEVDETYVGGKGKNMHKSRKIRLQQIRSQFTNYASVGNKGNLPGKTAVHGILDRETRKVRATVVPNIKRETLQNAILDNVQHGSAVFTDQAVAYDGLAQKYVHEVVNHLHEYVRGQVHTNGIENFWSLLKRGLHGTYVSVEPFHLFRYVDEQVFRFNNRGSKDKKITDADRFNLALSQVAGKRLTFAEVTGKGSPAN
jgi:transposase-like protein